MNSFLHYGDLGDIISFLPVVRQLGGGRLVIGSAEDGQRETMRGARFEAIKPLLESQPYIDAVEYNESPFGITHDTTGFRKGVVNTPEWWAGKNLSTVHANHFGINELDMSPWITCKKSQRSSGRVIVARTGRYENPVFPWWWVGQRFRGKLLFVGTDAEHAATEGIFKTKIEHAKTGNLLEVAEIIAGGEIFITSQSCPFWIGAAMGVLLVQETCLWAPSAVVPRPNANYVRTEADAACMMRSFYGV